MPASRKRNKGKDRKAKQLAKKEETARLEARAFWLGLWSNSTQCNHGCALIVSGDHLLSSFMDQFYIDLLFKKIPMDQVIRSTFVTHPQVWNNKSHRKLVIDILVRIGTNMFLGERSDFDMSGPVCIAQAIVVLEHYNDTDDIESVMDKRMVRSKWRDIWLGGNSSKRDALKFFRKRTSCKCLKKMHLEARKTMPKIGKCYHCKEEKDRVSLSVCSRCMVMHYCSRECQVADWPVHEEDCDDCVRAHKQQTAICQDK